MCNVFLKTCFKLDHQSLAMMKKVIEKNQFVANTIQKAYIFSSYKSCFI